MPRPATASELRKILSESSQELKRQLGIDRAQLMMPVDGKGLRIQVAMPPAEEVPIPLRIAFQVEKSELVEIRLEASAAFQDYKPHDSPVQSYELHDSPIQTFKSGKKKS